MFSFGSRDGPHPVSGQSVISFRVVGQGIFTFPVEAAGAGARLLLRRRCASLIEMNELKAKAESSSRIIRVRFIA